MRILLDLPGVDREGAIQRPGWRLAAAAAGVSDRGGPVGEEARRALALDSLACLFGFAFALGRIFLVGFTHPHSQPASPL